MTRIEKQVYDYLLTLSQKGTKSITSKNQELGEHFNCSPRSIQRTLSSLKDQGYISVEVKNENLGNSLDPYWVTRRYITVHTEI